VALALPSLLLSFQLKVNLPVDSELTFCLFTFRRSPTPITTRNKNQSLRVDGWFSQSGMAFELQIMILLSVFSNSIHFMTTRKRKLFAVILSALLALDMSVVIYVVHKLI